MRKVIATLIALITFVAPLSALASTQVFMAQIAAINYNNTTQGIQGTSVPKNDGGVMMTMPVAGTLSNLYVYATAAPGGTTQVYATTTVNGVKTSLKCTLTSASQSCSDNTNTVAVVAGDDVRLNFNRTGVPTTADVSWSMVFTPTTANDTVFFASTQNNGSTATTSYQWYNNAGQNTEANATELFPEAGTLDRFFASSTSIVSGSVDYFVFQNSATSTLTCTIGTPTFKTCSDTSNTLTIAKGDTFSLRQSPYSSTASKAGFGVRFIPTTAGNFDFMSSTITQTDVAGAVRYKGVIGFSGVALPTVEASSTAIIAAATTFTSMELKRSAAPGSGKNATVSLMVNSATSSLTCTLTGTGTGDGKTTKTCTGSVAVIAGDLLDYSLALDSGGTAGTYRIGLVASVPSGARTFGAAVGGKHKLWSGFLKTVGGFFRFR